MRLFFALAMLSASFAKAEEKAVTIPLKSIWALQMPDTRDVRKLGPDDAARIRVWLTERTGERAKAGPCFVVNGEGKDALANAARVLVDGEAPMKRIPAGKVVTLVFYSYSAPGYVAVKSVRHSSERITVKYQVITHQTSNATVHFALIPLGKLSPGNLNVNLVELKKGGPEQYPEVKERAICDSCSLVVQDGGTRK